MQWHTKRAQLTKPLTKILPSRPPDGPVGTVLTLPLAGFAFFLTPPTGVGAGLPATPLRLTWRRPLPPRETRRVEMISSRDLSSLADILMEIIDLCKGEKLAVDRIVRISF